MEKVSSYGIGCGSLLLVAGAIDLIGLALGWGESNKSIFQILKIVGNMAGSEYLGAGIFMVAGAVAILLGWGIPEILREDEPEKDKVAGSASPRSLPGTQSFEVREQSRVESYLNFTEGNLMRNGFQPVPLLQGSKAFYKKDPVRSSEFFFIPVCVNEPLTPEKVEKISQKTFEAVKKAKRANTLFCYPVIVSESVPADVQKFIQSYRPMHMAKFEFPVIVDLSSRKLFYYTGTPLWGGLMYGALRENAKTLLRIP